ncbi:ATP synthase subunit delta [Candidatus Erwinia haradaeae]|uniref:ATP synthase subunit delta n=1 Tax=Candidatus Erwinia haradaeae TaxID=1922217 RepID=A0A451DIQ3_9GAMM|nr:F0F1 ATP synthase subunit delta [Candidatus Erwinia haradaeae]VFP86578.1 ATP synthase subunit delta [Candidatus Erwinia haradaeae]
MFSTITIARPYARAAFHFAIEKQNIDHWQNMLTLATLVSRTAQIQHLINRPLSPTLLSEQFIALLSDQIDHETQNFIKIIAYNRRLPILPVILNQFIQLRAMHDNVMKVEVISSTMLSQKQLDNITIAMEKHLLCQITLDCKIDQSIIAGVILRVGDMTIDGSVRGQIKKLTGAILSKG